MPRRVIAALRRLSIRLKLTLAFAGVMTLVVTAVGVFLYLHFVSGLDASFNQALRAQANEVATLVASPRGRPLGTPPLRESGQNFAQILNLHGQVLDTSPGLQQALLGPGDMVRARHGAVLIQHNDRRRLFAMPIEHGMRIVVVGESLAEHEHAIETLGGGLLIGGPLALLLASLAAYGLAAAALRPVEKMRQRAATISAGDVGSRLPLPDSVDEIYRLGSTLNEMLARLEQGFEHERAFIADASHELRTPLAVLKAELEVALKQTRPGPVREGLASAVEESDRVIALAEDLLVLAAADRARLSLELRPVVVGGLLHAVGSRYEQVAASADRRLVVDPDSGTVLRADLARLQQALVNLVDNALRYGRGTISLSVQAREEQLEVHVTDEGPGFPPEFLEHAFERFSRADRARGRGGAGLGLAIVQAIARAHGGEAHVANRAGGGANVWLTLPATSGPGFHNKQRTEIQVTTG